MVKHWAVITGFQPSFFDLYFGFAVRAISTSIAHLKKSGKGAGTT
jgi:hypothetical protein